jgi:LDH2 family malate/lactate/ureidoglycolate dehydrogenase
LDGVLLPFGAHKGSGLAIVVELLAAAVPGALLSYQITDIWADPSSRMGTGHLVIALDPEVIAGPGVFEDLATDLAHRIDGARPATGHVGVHLPGDVERDRSRRSHLDGVALAPSTVTDARMLAERFDLAWPRPLPSTTPTRAED